MKKSILLTVVLAVSLCASAQNPTKQVSDTFNKMFSEASDVKWEQEKPNEWEAEFRLNGNETSASFDAKGNWMETEAEINKKDISADAHKAISLQYEGWEFEKAESVETPTFKGYEIVLEKENTETEILVTPSGEITIKKVSVEEDDEDEEHED